MIVTADDVGLHRGITLGAIKAHREGIVTACSVVANGRELDHAAALLRATPSLDVGVHLTLVGERPLVPAREVPSLVGGDGRFRASYRSFLPRYLAGRVSLSEVERELEAQLERTIALGLRPVHANGHQHLHVLPGILRIVLSLCERYGIRYLRLPSEPVSGASPRSLSLRALFALSARARPRLRRRAMISSVRTAGIGNAGHLRAEELVREISRSRGLVEIVAHPGIGGSEIASEHAWGYAWDDETAALCDPRVRAAVAETGSRLVRIAAVSH